mmetsp:Transcript_32030/g.102040  ORF Transcript_32030/g.102040 Transcript_32030/m.102040 type:complete len:435 (+) Transcript_32030:687-1991(+)
MGHWWKSKLPQEFQSGHHRWVELEVHHDRRLFPPQGLGHLGWLARSHRPRRSACSCLRPHQVGQQGGKAARGRLGAGRQATPARSARMEFGPLRRQHLDDQPLGRIEHCQEGSLPPVQLFLSCRDQRSSSHLGGIQQPGGCCWGSAELRQGNELAATEPANVSVRRLSLLSSADAPLLPPPVRALLPEPAAPAEPPAGDAEAAAAEAAAGDAEATGTPAAAAAVRHGSAQGHAAERAAHFPARRRRCQQLLCQPDERGTAAAAAAAHGELPPRLPEPIQLSRLECKRPWKRLELVSWICRPGKRWLGYTWGCTREVVERQEQPRPEVLGEHHHPPRGQRRAEFPAQLGPAGFQHIQLAVEPEQQPTHGLAAQGLKAEEGKAGIFYRLAELCRVLLAAPGVQQQLVGCCPWGSEPVQHCAGYGHFKLKPLPGDLR